MRDIEKYQEHYNSAPFEQHQVKYRKRKIIEILSRYAHNFIIEVGCGLSSIFNEYTDFKMLHVVEPGQGFCKKALNDIEVLNLKGRVEVFCDQFESWHVPPANNAPDFIIISSLLHEVNNPVLLLKKANEIAGTDTVIHINVPSANSFHRLLAVEMGLIPNVFEKSATQITLQQSMVFDIEKLKELVEKNGFRVVESGSYFFKPFTHKQMQEMLNAGFITEQMLDGFYKMDKYLPEFGSEIYVNVKKQ